MMQAIRLLRRNRCHLTRTKQRLSTFRPFDGPCFAFDIDGVISRGKEALLPGIRALELLYDSRQGWRAPVVFITNGGGVTEAARAESLSNLVGLPIDESMMVLSHTPLRTLSASTRSKNSAVLTVGGVGCAQVARNYGFPHALDCSHYAALDPLVAPYAAPLPPSAPIPGDAEEYAFTLPISAILVMTDSRDWYRDIQIMLDVLRRDAEPPQLYVCNNDIEFPTKYPTPRLAAGSFFTAFNSVYHSVLKTAAPQATMLGKPHAPNYEAAERALRKQLHQMGYEGQQIRNIFAIGDNPASDIRGANARGAPWKSVLVLTGNISPSSDYKISLTDQPTVIVRDALEAVEHGLRFTSQRASQRF